MANPFAVGVALSALLDLTSSTRKKQPKLKFPKLRTPERLKPYTEGSSSRKAMIKDE
tara:strand:- start:458 stop:628 length:171 start_codon:yes stop_codon:yes gene_type:complete